jgi:hypothetical protein
VRSIYRGEAWEETEAGEEILFRPLKVLGTASDRQGVNMRSTKTPREQFEPRGGSRLLCLVLALALSYG